MIWARPVAMEEHCGAVLPKSLLVPSQTKIVPQRKYYARCHWRAVRGLRPKNIGHHSRMLEQEQFFRRFYGEDFFDLHPRNFRVFTHEFEGTKFLCLPKLVYALQSCHSDSGPDLSFIIVFGFGFIFSSSDRVLT